ncbi:MAG: hypothetical protein EPN39_11650 [Chitinophagaceae bacterium]|nr:MAG: hypothetical protein EPN39_11650 [Chitinophagaceae bacterium]
MPTAIQLKKQIEKSIENMDEQYLRSAYLVLKGLSRQQKYNSLSPMNTIIEQKIRKGTGQLNNGEGIDFRDFLAEVKESYGRKK